MDLREHLIKLGTSQPHLQTHLRPILDRIGRRTKPLDDINTMATKLDRDIPLVLGDWRREDRGNRLMFWFVPDANDYEIKRKPDNIGYDTNHKAFTARQEAAIKGQVAALIEKKAKGWGYHISVYEMDSRRRREVDPDDSNRALSHTEALYVELQPYYPRGYDTPMSLINKGKPYAYHLTDQRNVGSIQSKGLVPRSSTDQERSEHTFQYPNRIYLFTKRQDVSRAIRDFVPNSHDDDRGMFLTKTPDVSILMVDLTEVDSRTKFYEDPAYPSDGAVFTYTHIPSDAIVRVINK